VTTFCVACNGQLYLTSFYYQPGVQYPHGRSWNENVARDPHVRLKIGDKLYDRTLSYVTDPAEKASFLQALAKKYPTAKTLDSSRVIVFHVLNN
jgi:hypothetical protein